MASDLHHGSGYGKGYDYAPSWREQLSARGTARAIRVVKSVVRCLLGMLGAIDALLHSGQRRPPLTPATFHPRRILVIRTDMLGDVVLTLPTIHALHRAYPQAKIDLVVEPPSAGIVAGHPEIDRIILSDLAAWVRGLRTGQAWGLLRTTIRELRAAHYDLAVSVCGDWASVLARLSGARRRVGYAGEAYPFFLTDPVPGKRYAIQQHETAYGLALAAHAGGVVDPPGHHSRRPRLLVDPPALARIADLLWNHGVALNQPIIVLHAGARNGAAKRWSLSAWARLAEMLIDVGNVVVVLVGSPGEREYSRELLRRMQAPDRVIDLTGATSLPELVALFAASAVVVTSDSGPLHIAEALGTPLVALHGPTDPVLSGPCGPEAIVIRHAVWCAPCYDHTTSATCRWHNPICMRGIAPAAVRDAVYTQLRRHHAIPVVADPASESEHPKSAEI